MSWKDAGFEFSSAYNIGNVWVGPSRSVSPAATRAWSAMAIRAAQAGRGQTGAAVLVPAASGYALGIVDGHAGIGVGIKGHVGSRAHWYCSASPRPGRKAWLRMVADAAAAVAPGCLGFVDAVTLVQRGAADR